MGWTSMPLNQPVKEWFNEMWNDQDREVLDVALVKRTQLYAAVRYKKHVPKYGGKVIAVTYLIHWSNSEYNFSYKPMTEHVGPYGLDECPKRIMKLLTPLNDKIDPSGYAREWRERVNQYHNMNDNLKKSDTVVRFDEGIRFSNGMYYNTFKKIGRSVYCGTYEYGTFKSIVRVSGLNLSKWMKSKSHELLQDKGCC